MKRTITLTLLILLLCGLCACAARQRSADVPPEKEGVSGPQESQKETEKNPEPSENPAQPPAESEPSEPPTEPQAESEPAEPQTEPQPGEETETKTVRLSLPYMKTEDFFSYWPEENAEAAGLTLQIPADWTEEAGLYYCPWNGSIRKVMEPVCLVEAVDDAQWQRLGHLDITQPNGETTFLSVTGGVDSGGREYLRVLGESCPDGGEISVWYPCFCYLRDTNGNTAVLTCYLLDPEDPAAMAELQAMLDSIRFE